MAYILLNTFNADVSKKLEIRSYDNSIHCSNLIPNCGQYLIRPRTIPLNKSNTTMKTHVTNAFSIVASACFFSCVLASSLQAQAVPIKTYRVYSAGAPVSVDTKATRFEFSPHDTIASVLVLVKGAVADGNVDQSISRTSVLGVVDRAYLFGVSSTTLIRQQVLKKFFVVGKNGKRADFYAQRMDADTNVNRIYFSVGAAHVAEFFKDDLIAYGEP